MFFVVIVDIKALALLCILNKCSCLLPTSFLPSDSFLFLTLCYSVVL